MRYTIFTSLVACLVVAVPGQAQAPRNNGDAPLGPQFLRDYAVTRGFGLGRPVRATPTPDGKSVLFLRSQPRVPKLGLYELDVASGKTRELLTPEQVLKGAAEKLSPEEKARRERMRVSVGGFTSFQLSPGGKLILVSLSGRLYAVERATGLSRELETGPGALLDPKFSPDGKSVAYVRDHDLYVLDLGTQKELRLTTGGTEEVTHGLAEFVAQEEMNRFSGYWWSPDSKQIAYEKADAHGVEVWYVADPTAPGRRPHPSYYPRPGKANVKTRLGVVAVTGGKTAWIDWDRKRYPYLASVHWPKGGPLLLTVQSRDQGELALLVVQGDKTTTLLKETDPTWLNLAQDVPRWLADGSGFLWTSEKSGGPQLELRGPDGKLVRVLVPPDAGYRSLVDVDLKKKEVFFLGGPEPMEQHLYSVPLDGGKPWKMTDRPGQHSAVFAKDHSIYVLSARPKAGMPRTTVHGSKGTELAEVPSVAEDPGFVPQVEYVKVGAEPGFYAAVIRPHGFDAKKRYPVVVDVYGGPLHQHVLAVQSRWLLDQWLADQGFIVVAIDNRGTPGRGRAWERALFKRIGSVPLEDQAAALKALGERFPEMDLTRVGIHGWSFGGYLSALAVLKRPDVYRAAVAGAPVVDWLDYDTHYTERYLGVPPSDNSAKDDPAYKEGSLLSYAADLRRPLLLLHGTADDNVYFRHSLRLVDALFRAGKDVEILPLPGLTHMVPDPLVMERLHGRIATFFQKHLGAPKE
jgi:dipeptidyl-peptidase-4